MRMKKLTAVNGLRIVEVAERSEAICAKRCKSQSRLCAVVDRGVI